MAGILLGPGGEFDLIRRFYAALEESATAGGAGDSLDVRVGPGDDCVVVAGDGIAVSTDIAVEDVHFRRSWLTPREIGYRAAAASLSDLAAVAARPIGILLSLMLPDADVPDTAEALVAGAVEAARSVEADLLGGDVARSPRALALDVVAVGEAPRPLRRAGARAGDGVWVTGRLGGAAAAVSEWLEGREPDAAAREAFARPTPRTREAQWLARQNVPRCMIDLSDGLAGDVAHLAAAGGVKIVLDAGAVPVHPSATRISTDGGLGLALSGGEDYELCFTAAVGDVAAIGRGFEEQFGVPLCRVGHVEPGEGVWLRAPDGSSGRLRRGGFQHFSGGAS